MKPEDHYQKNMNCLVIMPRANKEQFKYVPGDTTPNRDYMFPTSLPYITSALKHAGCHVDTINLNHEPGLIRDVIHYRLLWKHYDIIFTGGVSHYYHNIKDMIGFIREVSDAKIVVGGGLVSAKPELMVRLLKCDIVVRYEGELTVVDIVQTLRCGGDLGGVLGITYIRDGCIYSTGDRPKIKDLDSITFPDMDAFGFAEYLKYVKPTYIAWDSFDDPRIYPVVGSRGCPYNCTFCFHTIGKGYRQRSIGNIMEEIKAAVIKYHINVVFFFDELFAYDKPRALDFCQKFKDFATTIPWEIHLMLNLRVDCADDEILDAVKDAGVKVVGLGLESGSQVVLDSMKKHTTPQQMLDVFGRLKDRNLIMQGSFIFGDPSETLETAKETLDFIQNNNSLIRDGAYITFIMAFPGSVVYEYALRKGIIKDEAEYIDHGMVEQCDPHKPLNLTGLSPEDFDKLKEMVFQTDFQIKYSAVPESVTKQDNGLYTITVRCPHCGKMEVFRNRSYHANVGCKDCCGRFYATNRWFKVTQKIVSIVGFQRSRAIRNIFRRK